MNDWATVVVVLVAVVAGSCGVEKAVVRRLPFHEIEVRPDYVLRTGPHGTVGFAEPTGTEIWWDGNLRLLISWDR